MCGRFFLELKALLELEERIDYEFERDLLLAKDNYPSNQIPIIIKNKNNLNIQKAKWGFKTFDNKLLINARSETLLEKPTFKNEVLNHRCIVIASGFYEWDHHKHKFTFINKDEQIMYLAGLYRIVEGQKEVTIITTGANESMQGIHHRMPLILTAKQMQLWLNSDYKRILKVKPLPLKIAAGNIQISLF